MTFIGSGGPIDPRLTPILERDMANPFTTLTLPASQLLIGAGTDITGWATDPDNTFGNIDLAAGIVTLKANRSYMLALTTQCTVFSSGSDVGFAIYKIVNDSDNLGIDADPDNQILALALWPLSSLAPQATVMITVNVGATDLDVKVRCTSAAGTHSLQFAGTTWMVMDLGRVA